MSQKLESHLTNNRFIKIIYYNQFNLTCLYKIIEIIKYLIFNIFQF